MSVFKKCPVCSGKLVKKDVEKLIKEGEDVAIVTVPADVCLGCGERLYALKTVQKFEDIRNKLKRNNVSSFKAVGRAYQAH